MIVSDSQIRESIKSILQTASGPNTRVVSHWELGVDPEEWAAVARSINDPQFIDGWVFTRTKIRNKKIGKIHWEYEYHYVLWYFHSYRGGTESDNSEKTANSIVQNCITAFENSPTLGFDIGGGDGIHSHSELQIDDIDIVRDQMHVFQCSLVVYLTRQP